MSVPGHCSAFIAFHEGVQMRAHTTEFERLLEAMPDGMAVVDPAGVIRFVNRQMESMFGYERGDMVGLPIETLVPESLREVHSGHREGYNDAPLQRPMEET